MSNKLELDFMGGLTRFQSKDDAIRKFQVKTIAGDNDSEITAMVREIESWSKEHLVDELSTFTTVVPSTFVPWSKITIPVADYDMYFDVDFGQDMYSGEHGHQFKAKLAEIGLVLKKGIREATFTFLKNGEDADDMFQRAFLNKKEEDENGKKKPKAFKIALSECDSFHIGNMDGVTEYGSDESDDDDDDTSIVVEVHSED